ncbi:hypothetical protein BAnh1_07400 [Bartonella australis AUST/NH1]|uniref:DUF1561 domain-containing protein n=1 Tax=Bartonella australis (strain Aust/NH1) TaxID=1094489 RepID=M1N3Y9_BARAA|nr:DUF1561 family protein [Bartonella australis]AGF74619.1 hypothetical protein BAnh1_07400 [Bartonella australis AUST/NH1]
MKHDKAPFFDLREHSLRKKSNVKFLSFFFVFLLSLNSLPSFSAPIPQVIQKPADEPADRAIRVKAHNGGEYCYALAFVDGEGYVYLDNCSSQKVPFARYDVFQRIAWKIKDVWLCMTAPSSVTGIGGSATADWDYIKLRPCVINDANQRWIVKDNAFHTADEKFRVKDYKWYTYISKNPKDYYNHTLMTPTMDEWVKTIAIPGNMSFKTSLGWKYVSRSGFFMYYISNSGSESGAFDLYYNPENGHIARYFPSAGLLACMTSQQSSSEEWGWVKWLFCNDNVPTTKDKTFWDVSFLAGREGLILDYQNNLLRVTQYGSNWGFPYTAKPAYIKQDTQNSPTSKFVLDYDIERWNRYVMANVEDALPYCPAPGKTPPVLGPRQKAKRSLPPDFHFDDQWQRRLYEIAISTDDSHATAGMCGICLIHTLQMIAELHDTFPGAPRSRGYFFDTAPNVNPLISLENRYPLLYRAIEFASTIHNVPMTPQDGYLTTDVLVANAVTQIALPNYAWRLSSISTTAVTIANAIENLFRAPPGTVWIGLSVYLDGEVTRHALPILRSRDGLIIIPTNLVSGATSFEDFSSTLQPIRDGDIDTVLYRLTQQSPYLPFLALATLQLTGEADQPLSVTISQNNCTGEGERRRGSGKVPKSSLINQCTGGRCAIL